MCYIHVSSPQRKVIIVHYGHILIKTLKLKKEKKLVVASKQARSTIAKGEKSNFSPPGPV